MTFFDEFEKRKRAQEKLLNSLGINGLSKITQDFIEANSMSKNTHDLIEKYELSNTTHELQKTLDKLIPNINYPEWNETSKSLQPLSDSAKRLANALSSQFESINKNRDKISKTLQSVFNPIISFQETISDNLRNYFSDLRVNTIDLKKIDFSGLDSISKYISDINIDINTDGSISIEDEVINNDVINDNIAELLEDEEFLDLHNPPEIIINHIINITIQSAKITGNERIKTIITGIIANAIFFFLMMHLNCDNKVKNSDLKKHLVQIDKKISKMDKVQKKELQNFKIVSVNRLNVRSKNKQRSDIIGTLYYKEIVHVLKRTNSWSYIIFQRGNLEIEGWVFSRYLKNINFSNPQTSKVIK